MSVFKPGEQVRVADERLYRANPDGVKTELRMPQYFRGKTVTILQTRRKDGDYWVSNAVGDMACISEEHLSHVVDEAPTPPAPTREATLTTAANLVSGDRAKDYGDAAESFTRLAALWSPILGVDVTPEQVALCLTQLKISRLIVTPCHTDSWVDAAGYIALGSEIAARGREADG